jgi:CBS domain-containing protein
MPIEFEVPIQDFIDVKVPKVRLSDRVTVATEIYNASPQHVILVEDETGALAGIITDNDLTKLMGLDDQATVAQLATTTGVVAIKEGSQLGQLLRIMNGDNPLNARLDMVPVVDANQRPVGIVTRDSLKSSLTSTLVAQEVAGRSDQPTA